MTERINGIDLTELIRLEGQVVEPVPESERQRFKYWRAAHLGAIALNFLNEDFYLNARGVDYSHFQLDYESTRMAAGYEKLTQFGPEHRRRMTELADIPDGFSYPSIVLALGEDFNDGKRITVLPSYYSSLDNNEPFPSVRFDDPISPCGGHILRGPLKIDMLDPYSAASIYDIFGLDNA